MFNYYASTSTTMEHEVKVTWKGQTTIPAKIRRKHGIREGSRLRFIDRGKEIILKPALSTADLAGSGAKHASVKEMKRRLDDLRNGDV
jgi:AbrB family looped-hinge helix DNA binding protein